MKPPNSLSTLTGAPPVRQDGPATVAVGGKDWFEVKEGEATICKPDGTGYKVVARVQMDEWPRIAAAASK